MNLSFKEAFFKILAPVSSILVVVLVFNFNSLTSKSFFEIIFWLLVISFVGGLIIYLISVLYDKYEQNILNKISRRFDGERRDKNIIEFKYKGIEVFCERTKNIYIQQSEFNFHVPRCYILKKNRKSMEFIKPSHVYPEECFQIQSCRFVTEKKLQTLEDKLETIFLQM